LKVQDSISSPNLAPHEKQKSAVNDVTERFFRASEGLSPDSHPERKREIVMVKTLGFEVVSLEADDEGEK